MTKSIKVKATKSVQANNVENIKRLPIGTVVVHNYGEFTHGVIVGHAEHAYQVYFSADMSPMLPKYQANTDEAIKARMRTITLGKGFFVSRFKTIEAVREAQRKYKNRGLDLESAA
ncbi:hypothetical protein FDG95_gp386 [Pectobacterium phage vB_PcaM_CBB]|uniref:Uncharacterized protein n=1 Tax=Pectobacterium phage vB_PcaM_CBB TaxID=2772511 RepID=A0A1L2CVY0_9CAUD|nr:hypothetical protein FDG95_gp040 [Pectobacterium phage vB_PcaM_CBB]YP_009595133.1 hypothetical protein FDG95_gp386 [Pectobacterium phage vB_PcaM_CBB]AMM43605.1 hypothetical protein CBB_40 [Pectobacterium phage vB_PcaM_CBB]AMM44156.1 hypothetical protein CBB_593 [Pectobacterium phage vB_PcaM_CBB]